MLFPPRRIALRSRRHDQRGVAFPSPLVMLSIIAVAMAGIAFVATQDSGTGEREVTQVSRPAADADPAPSVEPESEPPAKKKKKRVVQRGEVLVEVYNNSNVRGLAGQTADRIGDIGWQVVGSDNWYGTIPATTVYYPERLRQAARTLARDLGVRRVQPAVDPMRLDRLTVILTTDFAS